jgi:hypothetical protein
MTISHVQVGGLRSVDVLGRMPRTEAEAKALVRKLNDAERRAREQAASASTQRPAAFNTLARTAQASPPLRRAALDVAAIYRQRNRGGA